MKYAKPTLAPTRADIEHAVCCWGGLLSKAGGGSCPDPRSILDPFV